LAPGARRSNIRWAPSPLFAGNWKRVMPKLFQAIPQKPLPVSKIKNGVLPSPSYGPRILICHETRRAQARIPPDCCFLIWPATAAPRLP
jgi:hypothetical protein